MRLLFKCELCKSELDCLISPIFTFLIESKQYPSLTYSCSKNTDHYVLNFENNKKISEVFVINQEKEKISYTVCNNYEKNICKIYRIKYDHFFSIQESSKLEFNCNVNYKENIIDTLESIYLFR